MFLNKILPRIVLLGAIIIELCSSVRIQFEIGYVKNKPTIQHFQFVCVWGNIRKTSL